MIFAGDDTAGNKYEFDTMKILKLVSWKINQLLSLVNIKLVKCNTDIFDMDSGLTRLKEHSTPIRTVLDIGASNGSWTINAMKIFPDASFIAIEPLHEREKPLRQLAQKYPNLIVATCVAGERDNCQVMLNVSEDLDGSTITGDGGKSRQVPMKTIDTIIAENNLKGPFLLKFDTHGYEVPILKGAMKTLENTSVIIMEVYNFNISETSLRFHEMCAYMENLGFRCFDVVDLMLREHDKAFWQMDLFFCRKDEKIFEYNSYK